jgi:citrate synthase
MLGPEQTKEPQMGEVQHGLEGVVAFETQIAEPDKEGSALRYRGVDIEDLVGRVPFENVWGLLVDGSYQPGMPPAEPFPLPVHSGDIRVDVQSAIALLAPVWGLRPLYDIDDRQARDDLARAAVMVLSYVAQAARGQGQPMVPQSEVDKAASITERFMIRWRGEPDPKHVKAVDAYWASAAEHGMNASTFTARVVASTGADVGAALFAAVGAMSGPLHGAVAGARHDRGGGAARGGRVLRQGAARRPPAADGLRAPGLPRRGPARPGAEAHRP